jgi:hypothetical protein
MRLLPLALLVACAPLRISTADNERCGTAGKSLAVYADRGNARMGCALAMSTAEWATSALNAMGVIIEQPWDVDFTWQQLGWADMAWTRQESGAPGSIPAGPHPVAADGATVPDLRVILVSERRPQALLHELLHAHLEESGFHGNHHAEMCRHPDWVRAEVAAGITHCWGAPE